MAASYSARAMLQRRLLPCHARLFSSAAPSPTPVPLFVADMTVAPPAAHTRPPLVFLHGLLGNSINYRSVAASPALNARRRIVAVDLRNHGRSPHVTDAPMTLEALSEDVAAALHTHGLQGAQLVGHSLGGKVGMMLALRHPSLLSQLVVLDISPRPYSPHTPEWAAVAAVVSAAAGLNPAAYRSRGDIDKALASAGVTDPGMRSFVMQNLLLKEGDGGGYEWRIPLAALAASRPQFAGFPAPPPQGPYPPSPVPTAFIAGAKSGFFTSACKPVAQAFFPHSSFHVLPDAGHFLHVENPAGFLTLLKQIVDGGQ